MTASNEVPEMGVPRGAVVGGLVLILGTILFTALAHPAPRPAERWMASRQLQFTDRPDGAVLVTDAERGDSVGIVAPGTGGFVRGTLRGLTRERQLRHIGRETPFELVQAADGRLVLIDPATSTSIELAAFGPTNAEAFRAFLPGARAP
jgi:putative photosynthetic complex assembly protein